MDTLASCWTWRPAQPSLLVQPVAWLRLDGAGVLRFLHGQSSQAIELATPGSCLASCLISPTARMRALAQVLVDAEGAWLVIEAGDGEAVRAALDRVLFPADRVVLGPVQHALLLTPLRGGPEAAFPAHWPEGSAGQWQQLSEHPDLWELNGHLLLRDGPLPPSLATIAQLDRIEQERWRLQQGWPASPGELNDDTNPFELGLAARVNLSKGCYVGQETLAKLATYDGVKQQLRRWCALQNADATPLEAGQTLLNAAAERAGVITSALALPQTDGQVLWLGLALVRRSALDCSELHAGDPAAAVALQLSVPEGFVAPPVGTAQR